MAASPVSRQSRSLLRSSVRGLIVVVLLIGAGLGWLVRSARIQRDAVAAIQVAGGRVQYNWEWRNVKYDSERRPIVPKFLVDFVGADFFGHVIDVWLSPMPATPHSFTSGGCHD